MCAGGTADWPLVHCRLHDQHGAARAIAKGYTSRMLLRSWCRYRSVPVARGSVCSNGEQMDGSRRAATCSSACVVPRLPIAIRMDCASQCMARVRRAPSDRRARDGLLVLQVVLGDGVGKGASGSCSGLHATVAASTGSPTACAWRRCRTAWRGEALVIIQDGRHSIAWAALGCRYIVVRPPRQGSQ